MSKGEIIITAAVIIICAAAFFIMNAKDNSSGYGVIYSDGKAVSRVPLDRYGSFAVPGIEGMIFSVDENGICVKESDCPDKICVKTGSIDQKYASAVCLPNKVTVTVEGAADEQ